MKKANIYIFERVSGKLGNRTLLRVIFGKHCFISEMTAVCKVALTTIMGIYKMHISTLIGILLVLHHYYPTHRNNPNTCQLSGEYTVPTAAFSTQD